MEKTKGNGYESPLPVLPSELGDGGDEGLWHAVDFKHDCPHVFSQISMLALKNEGCSVCKDPRESWYCLVCAERFCGRYIKGHAHEHFKSEHHAMFLGFVDLSVWCYHCDQYVLHDYLMPVVNELHLAKFGEPHPQYKGEIGILHDDDDEGDDRKTIDEKGFDQEKD